MFSQESFVGFGVKVMDVVVVVVVDPSSLYAHNALDKSR